MTDVIKHEFERLKQQASEIRMKIETLMLDPGNEEEVGSLNTQLDNMVNLIGLNPYFIGGEEEREKEIND